MRIELAAQRSDTLLDEFRSAGALLEGHFLLSSGRHSPAYLQCARVLMDPVRGERLCAALADRIRSSGIEADLCVSPAMGGVIVGYELARQLGLPSIFTERVDGIFALRRGFEIARAARVLVVEDVVTTGLSSRECMGAIERAGGQVVGLAALVDRSCGQAAFDVPFIPLISLDVPSYPSDAVPPDLARLPAVKPGSRGLKV